MMIINLLALGFIVICLTVILVVVFKKFPQLSNIDVETITAEREGNVKDRLLEEKLQRGLKARLAQLQKVARPIRGGIVSGLSKAYSGALELERKYKQRLEPKTSSERQKVDQETDSLVEQGYALLTKGQQAEAERKFIDAIALDPKDVEAYEGLGELYWEQGNLEQARQTYEYIIKLNADDFAAYSHLGNIALNQGKLEEARDFHLKSIDLDAQAAVHYVDLAEVYQRMGQHQQTYEALEKAHGLEPKNPRYLDALLEVCILLERKDEAADLLTQLKAVNPDNQKLAALQEKVAELQDNN